MMMEVRAGVVEMAVVLPHFGLWLVGLQGLKSVFS